jgi:hypothetical protein
MLYWYEPSHSKIFVGNLMLDRIFGGGELGKSIPEYFGVRLERSSVEDHLAQVREELDKYYRDHAEDIKEIRREVASFDFLPLRVPCIGPR